MKNNVFRQAGRTEDRVKRCTVDTVSTQRTDFTLAAAPLAAGIGQSHHDISSLPVRTPQRLQHVLWDCGASGAAVSISQRCHIPSAISPHFGLGWILLVAKLWEGICGPGVEGLFSKKSFYNSSVKLMSCMVVCCSKYRLTSGGRQLLPWLAMPRRQRDPPHVKMTARMNSRPHSFTP